jgi:hypothetical protein
MLSLLDRGWRQVVCPSIPNARTAFTSNGYGIAEVLGRVVRRARMQMDAPRGESEANQRDEE